MDPEMAAVSGLAALQRSVRALAGTLPGERATALLKAIGEGRFRRIGIHTSDAHVMQAAVLACAAAGADIVLLPHTAKDIVSFCDTQVDAWIGEPTLKTAKPLLATKLSPTAFTGDFGDCRLTSMTSGSTGTPKQRTFSLSALCEEAAVFSTLFDCDGPCQVRGTVSLQHRFGLTCHALLPLLLGWPVVPRVCAIFDELLAGETVLPVWWVTSPIFLARLAEHPGLRNWRGRVAGITCAGGRLDGKVRETIEAQLDVVITDIYGSSETGVLAARRSNDAFHWLPPVRAQIGTTATMVEAPWLSEATRLSDRIEDCGDRRFHLRGRCDSIVKLADKRVDLDEIQNILMTHEWVADVHPAVHDQHPHLFAWIALSPSGISRLRRIGRKALIDHLKRLVAARCDRIAIPRYWRLERHLPRNPQAKLTREQVLTAIHETVRAPHWQEVESGEALEMAAEVPLDLIYFRGHFDALGVVAGVVQLKWVCELAGRWLEREISPAKMENLKFQRLLRPGDPVGVRIRFDAPRDKLVFACHSGGHNCASGRIVL